MAVLGAKVFFIASGFAQQALLPKAIGLSGFGAWARVLALASIVNNVVITGSIQGVSRVAARSLGHERDAFRSVFRVHVVLAVALAALFAVLAPVFAWFEGAPHIVVPLLVMAAVVLLYGLYGPIIGLLNGRGEFTRQAGLDITFSVLRPAALLGLGWFFVRQAWAGVTGSTLGIAVAAACIFPLSMRVAFPLRTRADGTAATAPTPRGYLAELGRWPPRSCSPTP